MFIGFKMQIGCPHIEGIQEHFVKKLDDGRIFNFCGPCVSLIGCFFYRNIVKFKAAPPAHQRVHGFAG